MYYLLGFNENLTTIAAVSKRFIEKDPKETSFEDLKKGYIEFTRYIQSELPIMDLKGEINFVEDDHLFWQLIKFFIDHDPENPSKMIGGCNFKRIDDASIAKKKFVLVKDSLKIYKEKNQEHYFLFNFLFSYLILVESEHIASATIPKALGLLLLDHKEWSIFDLCEMFLHEVTHQLITLDEYRYGHYTNLDALKVKKNYALSATRGVKRPLNKVLHSLIVSYEILEYRKAVGALALPIKLHPTSIILADQITKTINSIKNIKDLKNILMPRAFAMVDLVEEKLKLLL